MSRRLLVGLPSDRRQIGAHPFQCVGEKYVRAVVDGAGAIPLLIPSLQPPIPADEVLAPFDGLLLTGAYSNIEPHRYEGGTTWDGNLHDPARDGTTLSLLPAAIAMRMPVLAICRGLQEVNVALGGTLHPKVHEVEPHADHREDASQPLDVQYGPAHRVDLVPGGLLSAIAGADHAQVNSLHGQGVARLAAGLRVEARAPDGLVEAVSLAPRAGGDTPFLLAVQWHPEWRVTENPFHLGLFRAFAAACRAYAEHR